MKFFTLFSKAEGKSEYPIIITVIVFAIAIVGGLLVAYHPSYTPETLPGLCCDTGNGAQCSPQTGAGKTITFTSPTSPQYKGIPMQYDLLKTGVSVYECTKHMQDSGQTVTYPDGKRHPIVINTSDDVSGNPSECPDPHMDQLADMRNGGKKCVEFPDDELIYVCTANCQAPYGTIKPNTSCDQNLGTSKFYGDTTTVFDVYFRDKDWPSPGVPDVIKNCNVGSDPALAGGTIAPSQTLISGYPEHKSLQLHTFLFDKGKGQIVYPRDFCKPAIYLYPQQQEQVHVSVSPKGNLNYSNPVYPANGWTVTANPSGEINYNNNNYDYLYYEAQIPDSLVPEQKTGYVVAPNDLQKFFNDILPKLGLNQKEAQQFSDYWLKALPKNTPYYEISLIPQTTIDSISPVTIVPNPDSILRIDMNFAPIDKKIDIAPPVLSSFKRTGFTVVEWGGMYKQDKNHPFTCFM